MTRVAIYGGSFDPPTLGHAMVVSHLLLNEPAIDKVLIVPCFKQTGKVLAPFHHRMAMCRYAFDWLPRIEISYVESSIGGVSITSRTIQCLYDCNPNWEMRFVIGGDLRESIKTWEGYDVIKELAPPLEVGRAGISHENGPTPICPLVSSTIVRTALAEGNFHKAERYIPAKVLSHIIDNGLYRKEAET